MNKLAVAGWGPLLLPRLPWSPPPLRIERLGECICLVLLVMHLPELVRFVVARQLALLSRGMTSSEQPEGIHTRDHLFCEEM